MAKPSHDDILQIISLITRKPVASIRPESALRGDLAMDSLAALDLLVTIEEKYGLVIDQEKAGAFVTLKDVLAYIDQVP